ncbi:MAG TPA: type II toxin-antitoxin system VapC family toxin [Myxococcota bacterium]|nr:type II toxin-antitoxin system VapC family toxin [Myxococcota bacterium]
MRFWDSSALVPLVVREEISPVAERWLAEDGEIVAWTLTPTEVISAVCRHVREGGLPARAASDADARVAELLRRSYVIADIEFVKPIAARMLRVHPLRAADALQLAAALAWSEGRPVERVFVTLDRRLGKAAEREGFRVVPDA